MKKKRNVKRYLVRGTAVTCCLSLMLATAALAANSQSADPGAASSNSQTADESAASSDGTASGQPGKGAPPSGEKPAGGPPSGEQPDGNPPEKPDGEQPNGTPPEKPDGEQPNGTPPEKPSGEQPNGTSPEQPDGQAPAGGPGGADTMTYDYQGTLSGALTADGKEVSSEGETTSAETADQNAALAENGGTLTITDGRLTKSGDDTDGDRCNFYGVNSILLAVGEATKAYVSGSELTAESQGSNGIFATDGAVVYANDTDISTTADNSRGLDATYGGTIVANLMNIATGGAHCAAIATDRGGGSVSVTDSTLTTEGSGSPLLYSTGDIQVSGVTGTASGSQIAGMEGLNTILIHDSTLESTVTKATACDPVANGVIIYQSTSGDAEAATGDAATFQAVDSTLKSAITDGAMFYLTNTTANVVLSGTTLDFDSEHVNLLTAEGNDANNWGTAGSNGAIVNFTGLGETLSGDISVDTISALNLYLLEGTTYTGAVSITENAVNTDKSDAPVTINVDASSKWVVSGDSTVTNLNVAEGGSVVDTDGKTVTIVADGKTVVRGDSALTVTVTGSYGTEVTVGAASQLSADLIDRSAFDQNYGTETAFTLGTESKTAQTEESVDTDASADSAPEDSSDAGEKEPSGKGVLYGVIGVAAAAVIAGVAAALRKND